MARLVRGQKQPKVPSEDGRSSDARLLRRVREALARHLGGKPSEAQSFLIEEIAWLTLHLTRMNEKTLKNGGVPSLHHSRQYLAYSNSRTRALTKLGLRGAGQRPPNIQEHIAARAKASL